MKSHGVREVKISDIAVDVEWYPRSGTLPDYVRALHDALEAGDKLPPITVTADLQLIDGLHRYHAHKFKGLETIQAEVLEGTEDDYWREAVARNLGHGYAMTLEEKRFSFRKVYQHHLQKAKLTEPQMAKRFGVSVRSISRWKAELEGRAPQRTAMPAVGPRQGTEPVRAASGGRVEGGDLSSPALSPSPSFRSEENFAKQAFDALRVACTYAMNPDVGDEQLLEQWELIPEDQRHLFFGGLVDGFPKFVEMAYVIYKQAKRQAPWEGI